MQTLPGVLKVGSPAAQGDQAAQEANLVRFWPRVEIACQDLRRIAGPSGHTVCNGLDLILALLAMGETIIEMGGVDPDTALPVLHTCGEKNSPLLGLGVGQFQRLMLDDRLTRKNGQPLL